MYLSAWPYQRKTTSSSCSNVVKQEVRWSSEREQERDKDPVILWYATAVMFVNGHYVVLLVVENRPIRVIWYEDVLVFVNWAERIHNPIFM